MMDIDFEPIKLNDVEEVYPSSLKADDVPAFLSRLKAQSYYDNISDDEVLVTADTVVIIDDEILGKPKTPTEACDMLRRLSGACHKVVTGVSLTSTDGIVTFDETTIVEFDNLSADDIAYYVEKYHPFDKAGSYGIQGYGAIFVDHLEGDYFSVMGLPLCALARMLAECGVSILREKEAPEG